MMDLKLKAYSFMVITLVSGALLPVLLALASGVNIYEFFVVTYGLSIPAAYLLLKANGKGEELRRVVTNRKMLALIAFTGIVTYFPLEFGIAYAEHFVSASLATVIFRTSPLLMLLLLPFALRERLTKYQIAAILLAFTGLYIGVSGGNPLGILQNSSIYIIAFLILMSLGYAVSVVLVKKYLFDVSALIMVSSVTMFALFAALFAATGAHLQALSPLQLFLAAYIGMFFNVISFYMYFYALKPLKATLITNVYFLSPFITFIFASMILGEIIQPYYLAIAVLTGTGILIQSFDRMGSSYAARSKQDGLKRMTIFDVTGVFANTGELTLNNTIRDGGRILAVKLPNAYRGEVNRISASESRIYTDANVAIQDEAKFVKDILGAAESEFVVMKAGLLDECEKFFDGLYNRIKG